MNKLIGMIVAAVAICFGMAMSAHASLATYTFSGVGSGTVADDSGTTFTDESFTFVFTADTTTIMNDAPFYRLFNVGGTFSVGAFNATLTSTNIIVATADLELINFFNSTVDLGLGLHNAALNGYDLSTSIGPLSGAGADLTPTFGGGGFETTGGASVHITSNTALTFTAAVPEIVAVPEPATLALLGLGLAGLGFARRKQ